MKDASQVRPFGESFFSTRGFDGQQIVCKGSVETSPSLWVCDRHSETLRLSLEYIARAASTGPRTVVNVIRGIVDHTSMQCSLALIMVYDDQGRMKLQKRSRL